MTTENSPLRRGLPALTPDRRAGFTLVELLISLTVGLVLVLVSLNFAVTVFRSTEGDKVREEVYRNARFVNMSLQRDIQTTGVGIESTRRFGTLSTFGDTVVMLHVPWEPSLATPYEIDPPPLVLINPLPPGGTCGWFCIDFHKGPGGSWDLAPGDLARLQVNAERHLVLVTGIRDLGSSVEVTIHPDTTLLNYEAAFQGGLLLDRFSTIIQKLEPIVYFVQDSVLYRSEGFNTSAQLVSSPMAYGVNSWDADLIFTDGDEAPSVNVTDGDFTNDFDDLLGVRISVLLGANRPIRVVGSGAFTRAYEWRLTPRNLMYERNR